MLRNNQKRGRISPNHATDVPLITCVPVPPDPFLDRARDLYREALAEAVSLVGENPDQGFWDVTDRVLEASLGFSYSFVEGPLLAIYREEVEEALYRKGGGRISIDPLAWEYLRLSLQFPDKGEEELLRLFRESVRAGNVSLEVSGLESGL